MAIVKVYRFQYFDGKGKVREADDFATEKAIVEMGAVPLRHTVKEVDDSQVGRAGLWIVAPVK